MRIVDVLYSLPFIFFVIMLVVFFGRNFVLMFVAIGAVEWLDMARIVRGQTLSIKRQEFVEAAEALGVGRGGILQPPHRAEPARPGRRLHDAAGAAGDPPGELPLLPRPRRAGADDQLGRADLGGANNIGSANWLLIFPAIFLVVDAVRAELPRRRPARRARPEGPLSDGARDRSSPSATSTSASDTPDGDGRGRQGHRPRRRRRRDASPSSANPAPARARR